MPCPVSATAAGKPLAVKEKKSDELTVLYSHMAGVLQSKCTAAQNADLLHKADGEGANISPQTLHSA